MYVSSCMALVHECMILYNRDHGYHTVNGFTCNVLTVIAVTVGFDIN